MNPTPASLDPSRLLWRPAVAADAEHLLRIYNESVAGGGHSPNLVDATLQEMRAILAQGRRSGWPLWVMALPVAPSDDPDAPAGEAAANAPTSVPVGWAHLRPIAWAPAACRSTGDLWLYVARGWHGSGIAMRMIRQVFRECHRSGFDAITCWILDANRRSLSLARACRLERWARMPAVAAYGERRFDLEVWGCRLDDPAWNAHMSRLERRYTRLERHRHAPRPDVATHVAAIAPA